ncbi:hypothetical protein [Haloferax sp. DFSO60]|uniref:hypothetical protein n=1 Tax=Haloferax sp. DFSO60 TaxID=3388652 RepID=UPI00397C5BB4
MLFRLVLGVLALLELLAPRQLVDFWMNLAAEGDEPVSLRPWVYTIARLEGVVILLWLLTRGDKSKPKRSE